MYTIECTSYILYIYIYIYTRMHAAAGCAFASAALREVQFVGAKRRSYFIGPERSPSGRVCVYYRWISSPSPGLTGWESPSVARAHPRPKVRCTATPLCVYIVRIPLPRLWWCWWGGVRIIVRCLCARERVNGRAGVRVCVFESPVPDPGESHPRGSTAHPRLLFSSFFP